MYSAKLALNSFMENVFPVYDPNSLDNQDKYMSIIITSISCGEILVTITRHGRLTSLLGGTNGRNVNAKASFVPSRFLDVVLWCSGFLLLANKAQS